MKVITKGGTQSTFAKELVALPTPCNDVVYYPAKLADLAGSKDLINEVYQVIPWSHYEIAGEDNKFDCKEAPSLQSLEDYFIHLKEQ